jgi:NAD+ kinase
MRDQCNLIGAVISDDRSEIAAAAEADLVVVLGGDGSILQTGHALGFNQRPILGVNLGKLGYLADFDEGEFKTLFHRVAGDASLVSERMMMETRVVETDGTEWKSVALNDCVVRVGDPYRTLTLAVSLNGYPFSMLHGDGVILATPTGSTAHNMSCGGPLVEPEVDAIILTPRCPHSFTHRPIVMSGAAQIDITMVSEKQSAAAVVDGQHIRPLKDGSRVEVRRSEARFKLVRNPDRRPWETLTTKLKWGLDIR